MKPLPPISLNFNAIKRYRVRMIIIIAVAWTVIDCIFYLFHLSSHAAAKNSLLDKNTLKAIVLREINVYCLSLLMAWVLIFLLRDFFRNLSFLVNILFKTVILLSIAFIMNFFIHFTYATIIAGHSVSEALATFYRYTFESHWLVEKTPEWVILFILTQLMIEINEKYSPGVFLDIMLGKYKQPRDERRIIMFIDLKDSTPIAEKLGHKDYFKFIRDFIYFVSTGIMEYSGRIYQYVGDEIVVTWPESRTNAKNAVYALVQARKTIHRNMDVFLRRYGVAPEFKAGIHTGEVTIGEIGVIKKDLVMSGDPMNTAARIRTACTELNQKFIVSKDFLDLVSLKTWQAETLGPIELKGKNASLELFALKI